MAGADEAAARLHHVGREGFIRLLEERFRFLAADSALLVRGIRPQYRDTLLGERAGAHRCGTHVQVHRRLLEHRNTRERAQRRRMVFLLPTLSAVRRRLGVKCPATLVTADLEAEIFLHLLQQAYLRASRGASTRALSNIHPGESKAILAGALPEHAVVRWRAQWCPSVFLGPGDAAGQ